MLNLTRIKTIRTIIDVHSEFHFFPTSVSVQSYCRKTNAIFLSLLLVGLVGCDQQNYQAKTTEIHNPQPETLQYQQEFETWKATQNQQHLQQYQQRIQNQLQHAPSLYELTLNAHPFDEDCEQYRFALALKSHWNNLLPALKLLEQLQQQGLFAHYKIVSVYRSPEANACARGAKASRHLSNHAVDFQTLDASMQPYPDDAIMDQKLCQYWHEHGKALQLGLGLYGKQRYHIDRQGYRTWGIGYGSASSPCLKP